MSKNFKIPNIRLFVFGTLRRGGKFDFYMEGTSYRGLYYTEGQLMASENNSAYIDFDQKKVATIGELHDINFFCLQRINHLESTWGEFPKAYDLILIPVWSYQDAVCDRFEKPDSLAFCYKRRQVARVESGDWEKRKNVIEEIKRYFHTHKQQELHHQELTEHIVNYLVS